MLLLRTRLTVCFFATCLAAACADSPAAADSPVDYSRDILPIFANRCYACHGPDESQRQAELRLDVRDVAIEHAITPGNAADSELIARVTSSDPDIRMPPAASKKPPLNDREVELLKRWIDEGANYAAHWAFATPSRPDVPDVKDAAWPRGAIDRFVLARLDKEGLSPSPTADPRTLARRLSFDLIGLPPKPQEVDAIVADSSDEAYEAFVDRLLASKHYGERMAMYWLDLVRYADTNGIHGDNHRDHAPYRDWVIGAFNENMPFDQFTIEQLAGDLLANPTTPQKIASGYNRLNLTTREGGAQPKEYMAKYAADRVRNAASVWMGSTLACAECHDHKFDPFTTRDFYSFAAFFADVQETAVGTQQPVSLPMAEQEAELARLDEQIASVEKQLNAQTPELAAAQAAWEKEAAEAAVSWSALAPVDAKSAGGATLKTLDDGSFLASGKNPEKDDYAFAFKIAQPGATAIRVEVMPDDSLPSKGPGRAANGNFVLSDLTVQLRRGEEVTPVELHNATATFSQDGYPVAAAIDGQRDDPKNGWAIHGRIGAASEAVFELKEKVDVSDDQTLAVTLHQNYGSQHTIGRLRISATSNPPPILAGGGIPANIQTILTTVPDKRTEPQSKEISSYYRSIAPLLAPQRKQLAELRASREQLVQSFPKILITTAGQPRAMRVLPRGNWLDESGPVVQPAIPAFLGEAKSSGDRATRLDLARWIVAPDNPLTARVMVNRLWKLFFGHGLVTTPDDFGAQGSLPSHPELLDHLAVEFIESGWDVKHIVKLIVMSSAYRQSSFVSPDLRERDPTNALVARQGRFRLPAEMVRDNALAISGLLSLKMGGPSVKPYQPAGYWSHLNFPKREYQHDTGEDQYRRGLYTYWCRTFVHPSLLAFDAPSREECAVKRPRSNTPLQALVLLNDPTYVESARMFAERIIRAGGESAEGRIQFAMRTALLREADDEELSILSDVYQKHLEQYRADAEAAGQVLSVGLAKPQAAADAVELAAWTSVARVILNLHETITRY